MVEDLKGIIPFSWSSSMAAHLESFDQASLSTIKDNEFHSERDTL